ncbi:HD-GYP domain-containing protein [Pseudomarimonas arenosa]|uniref:HD-GYP domain-containing protein n=1 Tax=Pseudomarimonas arenosa TaxID=2774145 RepID=A0AAW3ZLC6_9GAMM|nr:HD-GYP domain-containing protein [Pseudomarimonas arenosa]MBD8525221.1 HD-GYP domain-containing protein [Pseudomarimonas arenosa]
MIRKIASERLRPGMYIHELGGSWMSHPFWRSRFEIRSDEDVQRILDAGIDEVYIDTERGIDDRLAVDAEEVREQLVKEMVAVVPLAKPRESWEPIPVSAELRRAREVHGQAHRAVHDVMRDVRMGRAIQTGAVSEVVETITGSIMRSPSALIGMVGLKDKDNYTFLHSVSVGTLMIAFGRTLGMEGETLHELGMGGLLHDVGKMKVPNEVLNKPGRLSDAEFEIIKRHPVDGHQVLVETGGLGDIPLDITRHHHERKDGSGYPDRQKEDEISRFARMAAIVDVYDAITADRCYHKAMEPTEALRKMWEWSAQQFDRELLQVFMKCIGIYPIGSLVRLESGLIGVVVEQNPGSLLTPKVKTVYHSKSMRHVTPAIVDLSQAADKIASTEAAGRWPVDPALHIRGEA